MVRDDGYVVVRREAMQGAIFETERTSWNRGWVNGFLFGCLLATLGYVVATFGGR